MKSILFIALVAMATIGCGSPEKSTGSDTSTGIGMDTTATTGMGSDTTTSSMPMDTTTSTPNPSDTTTTDSSRVK